MRVLFVCTGNICRSPTAEGVLRLLLEKSALHERVEVDSAGTHDYHVGEPPDRRAIAHAGRRGYDISSFRARQVSADDFETFDVLIAMDRGHLRILERLCPPEHRHKLRLFLAERDVPDPYYGGAEHFDKHSEEDVTAFFLTDYLARHFDKLIWQGLGLKEHPELLPDHFGNYTKLVYLAQTRDEELAKRAMAAARKLGLAYEYRYAGYGELETSMRKLV